MSYAGGSYSGGSYQGHHTLGGASEGSHETHPSVLHVRGVLADIQQKSKVLYDAIPDSSEPVRPQLSAALDAADAIIETLLDAVTADAESSCHRCGEVADSYTHSQSDEEGGHAFVETNHA